MEKIQLDLLTPKTSDENKKVEAPIEFNLGLSYHEDSHQLEINAVVPEFGTEVSAEFKPQADGELLNSLSTIPNKLAFKIGEVAEMLDVKQYVLRYWETEFEALKPRKSKNNQRVYTRREVETALLIKKLLYTDRFSIEGARSALKQLRAQVREEKDWKAAATEHMQAAEKVRGLLKEIRRISEIFAK